MNAVANEPPFQ